MSLYIRRVINSWSEICNQALYYYKYKKYISFIPVRVPVRVPTKKNESYIFKIFFENSKRKKNQVSKTKTYLNKFSTNLALPFRVSVQGVKSLGGHFACLCRGFDFYEVKKKYYYFKKRKGKYFYTFNHFYSEKSSKRAK